MRRKRLANKRTTSKLPGPLSCLRLAKGLTSKRTKTQRKKLKGRKRWSTTTSTRPLWKAFRVTLFLPRTRILKRDAKIPAAKTKFARSMHVVASNANAGLVSVDLPKDLLAKVSKTFQDSFDIVHSVLTSIQLFRRHLVFFNFFCKKSKLLDIFCDAMPRSLVKSCKCSRNAIKMQSKSRQNAVEMQSKCSQNAVKMQPKCSQNAGKMQAKCRQNAGKIRVEGGLDLPIFVSRVEAITSLPYYPPDGVGNSQIKNLQYKRTGLERRS